MGKPKPPKYLSYFSFGDEIETLKKNLHFKTTLFLVVVYLEI